MTDSDSALAAKDELTACPQLATHVLAAGLRRHGVDTIFGQSIPAALLLVTPDYGIRQVGYRTENAAGTMADGYARISGKLGVVCAQAGPAATLLVPPMAEALKASTPIVAIIEDIVSTDRDKNAFQELDHLALFHGVSKWSRRVDHADRIEDYLDMAVIAATSGRPGPVALIIPRDVLVMPVSPRTERSSNYGLFPLDRVAAPRENIAQAARWIAEAKRPLIVAGGGAQASGAAEAIAWLSELATIPVATTNMGKGITDERAPLSLGVFGNTMGAAAGVSHLRHYATGADLIVLIGSRTNENGTDGWRLYSPGTRIIHIDLDPMEIGRNYDALRLAGDAKVTVEALAEAVEAQMLVDRNVVREEIAAATAAARDAQSAARDAIGIGQSGALRPEHLMRVLDELIGPDDIVVTDASYSTNWAVTYLTSKAVGSRFVLPRGLAGLGWGLPLSIGAKLARPAARVVAIVGDGGFGHCWSELETARRMNIPVVVIVLNNEILGFQCHGENAFFAEHTNAVELGPVDHAMIANACGCYGQRVTEPDEFGPALERALASGRPALLDVMIDPMAHPPLTLLEGRTVVGPRKD